MASDAENASLTLILNYRDLSAQVYDRVVAAARQHWTASGSYRDADITRIAGEVTKLVQAGQQSVSQLTALYLNSVLTASTGQPISSIASALPTVSDLNTLRGIAPKDEYQRPGVQVWTALSQGAPFEQAAKQGLDRLMSLVTTDIQMAQRWTEHRALNLSTAKFYRRVPRGTGSCMLCIIASTQRYHVKDLKPIHPGCHCTVAPLVLANGKAMQYDPGQIINRPVLEQAHADVKALTGGSDRGARDVGIGPNGKPAGYRDIQIRQHGELGPVLTWRSQHFTGPGDLADAA